MTYSCIFENIGALLCQIPPISRSLPHPGVVLRLGVHEDSAMRAAVAPELHQEDMAFLLTVEFRRGAAFAGAEDHRSIAISQR